MQRVLAGNEVRIPDSTPVGVYEGRRPRIILVVNILSATLLRQSPEICSRPMTDVNVQVCLPLVLIGYLMQSIFINKTRQISYRLLRLEESELCLARAEYAPFRPKLFIVFLAKIAECDIRFYQRSQA